MVKEKNSILCIGNSKAHEKVLEVDQWTLSALGASSMEDLCILPYSDTQPIENSLKDSMKLCSKGEISSKYDHKIAVIGKTAHGKVVVLTSSPYGKELDAAFAEDQKRNRKTDQELSNQGSYKTNEEEFEEERSKNIKGLNQDKKNDDLLKKYEKTLKRVGIAAVVFAVLTLLVLGGAKLFKKKKVSSSAQ